MVYTHRHDALFSGYPRLEKHLDPPLRFSKLIPPIKKSAMCVNPQEKMGEFLVLNKRRIHV